MTPESIFVFWAVPSDLNIESTPLIVPGPPGNLGNEAVSGKRLIEANTIPTKAKRITGINMILRGMGDDELGK